MGRQVVTVVEVLEEEVVVEGLENVWWKLLANLMHQYHHIHHYNGHRNLCYHVVAPYGLEI